MRTNINQGRIQSLAVMIVMLINNDQTPYLTYYRILGLTVHATSTHCFQLPSPRSPENLSVMKSSRYPVLLESFCKVTQDFMHLHFRESQHLCCRQKMSRINFIDCRFFAFGCVKPHCQFEIADVYSRTAKDRKC